MHIDAVSFLAGVAAGFLVDWVAAIILSKLLWTGKPEDELDG